jgi:hypothetical protein
MLRSNAAKNWQPDPAGAFLIDRLMNYDLAASRAARYLRSLNQVELKPIWDQAKTDFYGNPDKYPAVMASPEDAKERELFRLKCDKYCFQKLVSPRE